MKILFNVLGALLGLVFLMASVTYLLHMAPMPTMPPGSPPALFMGAFVPTGYMTFVKCCELVGGLLVAIPKTRNFGLLILGPIAINILAFTFFVGGGANAALPLVVGALCVILLIRARKQFAALAN